MNMVAQARKMFEEKIARHKDYRDRLVCANAPRSQIEFVERCIADLEKMIAPPAEQDGRALSPAEE